MNMKAKLHLTKERELRKDHMRLQDTVFSSSMPALPAIGSGSKYQLLPQVRQSLRDPQQLQSQEAQQAVSYYQPYYHDMESLKEVIHGFSEYSRERAQKEMLEKHRASRRKTLYEVMDMQRTGGRSSLSRVSVDPEGRRAETLVRKDAYGLSKRNLSTLSQLLDKLRSQYYRTKCVN